MYDFRSPMSDVRKLKMVMKIETFYLYKIDRKKITANKLWKKIKSQKHSEWKDIL